MKQNKPTPMWIAWEKEQEKLTSGEIEAKMKLYKKTSRTRAGYMNDAKWKVWTELLRDKKLQSLLGE